MDGLDGLIKYDMKYGQFMNGLHGLDLNRIWSMNGLCDGDLRRKRFLDDLCGSDSSERDSEKRFMGLLSTCNMIHKPFMDDIL